MDIISPSLKKIAEKGALPHAVLLEGANSLQNALFASNAAVCTSDIRPCGDCFACRKAKNKSHPDIIFLEPEKENNPYSIKEIRRIRNEAYILPNEASKKVYIFTKADNISIQSQNALLKIIEEPPAHAMFIFCCSEKSRLLDTIISRVSCFSCGGLAVENNTDEKLIETAKNAFRIAAGESEYELIKFMHPFIKSKTDFSKLLSEFEKIARALYLIKSGALFSGVEYFDIASDFEQTITLNCALNITELVINAKKNLEKNANMQLTVSSFCLKLKSALT